MIAFLDTNVLLDSLSRREPFWLDAARIWALAERGEIQAYISAVSFSNIYYILRKAEGQLVARKALVGLRDLFTTAACDRQIIDQAIDAGFSDFEDAIQFFSAMRAGASHLVTRDPGHFPRGEIAIVTPAEFLLALARKEAPPQ